MEIYTPENTANLSRSILWQYEKATKLQSLITSEQEFFDSAVTDFWNSYREDIFNIDTANSFGLRIWGINLGVERPNYDSYVPVTVSTDSVPAGLQPSTTWTWSGLEVNGERIYYDPTETWANWYSISKGWIFSTVSDVGNEGVIDYFNQQDYPDTITVSGAGDVGVNGSYAYNGIVNNNHSWTFGSLRIEWSLGVWMITAGGTLTLYYVSGASGGIPDKTGWQVDPTYGTAPAPTLAYTNPSSAVYWGKGAFSGTLTLSSSTEIIPFTNDMYRALLKSRLILMQMKATIPNINAYMEFLFPESSVSVEDGLDMTITYRFLNELSDEELAVLSVDGILPRPAGVKSILALSTGEQQFGFEGQYRLAADPSTQLGNFDNSSFAAE